MANTGDVPLVKHQRVRRGLYALMLLFTIMFIFYVTYMNFVHDPQAEQFLSHKTDLKRELHTSVWLKVMYVHVIFACLAMIAGGLNFAGRIQRNRTFHKILGYLYVTSVAITDLTSGYMAPYSTGGKINSIAFNMVNILWLAMTVIAVIKIKKKDVYKHRIWMVRSYAFCFTNMFIHLYTFIFHKGVGIAYTDSYTIGVLGAIFTLILLAELVIRIFFKDSANLKPHHATSL